MRMRTLSLIFIVFYVFASAGFSSAEVCAKPVAKVVSIQGTVQAKRAGEAEWQNARLNDAYCTGDRLRVQKNSRAGVALVNHPVLHLDQNSAITFGGVKDERTSVIDLLNGAAHFFSRVTRNLEVRTASVNAGVEGTEFFIRADEASTFIAIFEGKVLASSDAGSVAITSGQSAATERGKAPVLGIAVRPWDAVRWAIYYPPVIYYRPAEYQGYPETDWRTMVSRSLERYWNGDISGALSSLEAAPGDVNDPRFYTYRASLLLTVGRVEEASADINRALNIDPNNSDALALQSLVATAANEREKALALAQKAIEKKPQSASARVALSYAMQAEFDLKGALASLKEAVRLQPENALAWARLAELRLSFGELDEALKAAQKAAELNPNLARTQTVLGFAYLTRVRTKEADAAFNKAIGLDSADPLPRLGLGLSQIREGHLSEGRRDIEIAMSLDPNNSLIRSYLGKAYFEEKRDKLATGQYDMAKELDPLDPTSFFYDAILKQTTNRPVEALDDVQKAIELNDNRAVYRSRLLLDADLAARSAGLARIYTDLGFQQLALVEGWKSENADPADFSGHRFLADTYSVLPRHEIARVSELLQSQLLQPLNISPIQPHLAESNLFIISGAGPADLSFNEFNPLFNRDRVALQVSGITGENGTFGEEVSVAGIYKNASISVGQFHYETDGFRDNSDIRDDIYNAFVQVSLSPETSIQAEYRQRNTEKGDLRLRFFPEDFFPGERNKEERQSYRLGLRHDFSPNSTILASYIHEHADVTLKDDQPVESFFTLLDIKRPESADSAELQYLLRSQCVDLVGGVGYVSINGSLDSTFVTVFPPPDDVVSSSLSTDLKHTNFYVYPHIKLIKNLTVTVGASGDIVDGEKPYFNDKSQFNPKFGLTWNPMPNTTVRAAAFRVLKRTLITNQTLEPTQVAGFNQFFDDVNGTESWRYGVALDQKFSKDIFGGLELSGRDLKVPILDYTDLGEPIYREVDWNEKVGRAYAYWTPHKWLALKAEYQYERIDRDEKLTDGPIKMTTHRLPLGVGFFHPSGFSVSLRATYINQKGDFIAFKEGQDNIRSGKDAFWTVDTAVSYRLPKRYGFVTVGATNLFDKKFEFFDTDTANPMIQPKRLIFARATFSF